MISVSPPGQRQERKARDLNPHGLAAARFSKPARQPVSGYPPYAVDPAGVEPAFPARQAGVVPLDHRPMQPVRGVGVEPTLSGSQGRRITAFLPPARVDRRGIAPRFPPCDGGVFLLDEQPQRGPAGDRTRSSALTRAACGRNTSRPSQQPVPPAGLEPAVMPPRQGGAVASGPRG